MRNQPHQIHHIIIQEYLILCIIRYFWLLYGCKEHFKITSKPLFIAYLFDNFADNDRQQEKKTHASVKLSQIIPVNDRTDLAAMGAVDFNRAEVEKWQLI